MLMGAFQAEKECRWLKAAKTHKQELIHQTNNTNVAEIWQRIGFCYDLASRQADSSERFKKLRQLATKAYKTAAQLFSKERPQENAAKSAMCLALSEYSKSWLSSNSFKKQKISFSSAGRTLGSRDG